MKIEYKDADGRALELEVSDEIGQFYLSSVEEVLAGELNLSITAGLQRIKIFIIKSSSIRACCFLRHAVFAIVYPYSLVYIGVWNKKRKNQTWQLVLSPLSIIHRKSGCAKTTLL